MDGLTRVLYRLLDDPRLDAELQTLNEAIDAAEAGDRDRARTLLLHALQAAQHREALRAAAEALHATAAELAAYDDDAADRVRATALALDIAVLRQASIGQSLDL